MSIKNRRYADPSLPGEVSTVRQIFNGTKRFLEGINIARTAVSTGNISYPSATKRAYYNLQRNTLPTPSDTVITLTFRPESEDGDIIWVKCSQTPRPETNQRIRIVGETGANTTTISGQPSYDLSYLNETVQLAYEYVGPNTGLYHIVNTYRPVDGRSLNATANTPANSGNIPANVTRFVADVAIPTGITLSPNGLESQDLTIQNVTASPININATNHDAGAITIAANARRYFKKLNGFWVLIK